MRWLVNVKALSVKTKLMTYEKRTLLVRPMNLFLLDLGLMVCANTISFPSLTKSIPQCGYFRMMFLSLFIVLTIEYNVIILSTAFKFINDGGNVHLNISVQSRQGDHESLPLK
jgi:hypothetical protein